MPALRTALIALCALSLAAPAAARDEGVKVKVQDKPDEYSYEYEGPGCKFKYKLKHKDGEEEVEEEGDCPPPHALPDFAPPASSRTAGRLAPGQAGGFCDRALAGAVSGAAAGGAIGGQLAPGDEVALVLGGIVGGVLGQELGRRIDEADRRCMGRALAHAGPGADVGWTNPESDLGYDLRRFGPIENRHGVPCRSFEMRVEGGRWRDAEACQRGDGGWQLVGLR